MATLSLTAMGVKKILNNEKLAYSIWKQAVRWNILQKRKTRMIPKPVPYHGRLSTKCQPISSVGNGKHILGSSAVCLERLEERYRSNIVWPTSSSLVTHPLQLGFQTWVPLRCLWTSGKCFEISGKDNSATPAVERWGEAVQEKKEKFLEAQQDLIEDIRETKAKMREQVDAIIERENIWTVPNLLCISRIICSPYLCYLVMAAEYKSALGLFMIAGFTDLLDGWIARTFPNQASRLGSFLDPLADKVLVAILFLSLTYVGLIPVPLTAIIIYRDIIIIGGASFVRYKSLPPPKTIARYFDATHATAQLAPTMLSKINTAIQLSLITASLAAPVFAFADHQLLKSLVWFTGATTIASGVSYIFSKDTYKILNQMKKS